MNKFITENDIEPGSSWVVIGGPTCIGKSHFCRIHKFYNVSSVPGELGVVLVSFWEDMNQHRLPHHHLATTSNPKHWPSGWFSEDYIIKKRAIVLGAPYLIWKERIKKRELRQPVGAPADWRIHKFKNVYEKWVRKLEKYNIPYILVDNRNDYPILDKSSFFIMLTEDICQ